jgi:hypothetical protein
MYQHSGGERRQQSKLFKCVVAASLKSYDSELKTFRTQFLWVQNHSVSSATLLAQHNRSTQGGPNRKRRRKNILCIYRILIVRSYRSLAIHGQSGMTVFSDEITTKIEGASSGDLRHHLCTQYFETKPVCNKTYRDGT